MPSSRPWSRNRLLIGAGGALVGVALAWVYLLPLAKARYWSYLAEQRSAQTQAPPEDHLRCPEIAPSPIPRFETRAAAVGGKLYLFGGFTTDDLKASSRCDVYDPASDSWRRLRDLPEPATHSSTAVDGSQVWLAGGFVGNHPGAGTAAVWRYDTRTDSWEPAPPLPEARAAGGLVVLGGSLHYFGGVKKDRHTDAGDHWVLSLDRPERWENRKPMLRPRNHLSAVTWRGRIVALGGQRGHDQHPADVAEVDAYDDARDSWVPLADMPFARSHFEAAVVVRDDRILVLGGRTRNLLVYDISAYDPELDRWRSAGTLPQPVMAPVAVALGDRVLIGTGGLLPSGTNPARAMMSCPVTSLERGNAPRSVN